MAKGIKHDAKKGCHDTVSSGLNEELKLKKYFTKKRAQRIKIRNKKVGRNNIIFKYAIR